MATPQIIKDFFVYTSPVFSNIGANASQTQNISILADSDFEIQKLTMWANIANGTLTNATQVLPNLNVLITDTGSGRQFMNTAVPVASLFGTAQNPFILPMPKLVRARSVLAIQVTNFDAAVTTYQLYLSFIGNKIYTL